MRSIALRLLSVAVFIIVAETVKAQLKANFTPSSSSGCTPLFVSFQNTSTGGPVSYSWYLGNGITSTNQNPSTTYVAPGTYNVRLVVTTASGVDSFKQDIVVHPLPEVHFAASDTAGCFPLKVNFTDNTIPGASGITSWQWDFGPGSLSTQQNPQYIYNTAGINTVTLRVVNSNGCSNIATKQAYIKILDGVKAGFNFFAGQGCSTPSSVSFTNTTGGTGSLSYQWFFGDGGTSTAVNPTHTYQNGGSYTVKLVATNSVGCTDTIIKAGAVNIGFVKAIMSVPDTVCAGQSFNAINVSNPSTFIGTIWNFGDGNTANTSTYSQSYTTPGTYTIKLFTDFGSCSDSTTKKIVVTGMPVGGFTATNRVSCQAPLIVSFTNQSTGNNLTYSWDFGDGGSSSAANPVHTYTTPGVYNVGMTVTSGSGCWTNVLKNAYVQVSPPKINGITQLPVRGCVPLTITPTAILDDSTLTGSYLWDFGDGTTSTSATPSHTYTTSGVFTVKVTLTTAPGCSGSFVLDSAVRVGVRPHVNFDGTPRDICAKTEVNFSDSTTPAPIHEWMWLFGDGGTSSDQNPIYMYNDTGYFNVTLIAYNYGCSDTLKIDSFIHVRPPIAKFDTSYTCSDPLRRNFIDQSIGPVTWAWDFGDNQTSNLPSPSHLYASPGNYIVTLKVTNGSCEHTSTKTVAVIKEAGTLAVSSTESCLKTRINYSVNNIDKNNVTSYTWFINGFGNYAVTGTDNPIAWTYSTAGTRNVAVAITDVLNCKDTFYAAVPIVTYGVKAKFSSNLTSTCFGNTINFIDSSISDGIHPISEWVWDYGEGSPQTYTSGPFSHDYSGAGSFDVTLKIKDSYGCKDSITKPAFVSITKPVARFVASDTMLCPSSTITFTNLSQASDAQYGWDFGDHTTSTDISPSHSYSSIGSYTVKLIVTDKNGCKDSATAVINVFPAKANFTLSDTFTTCPPLVVSITNQSVYTQLNWDFGDGNASIDSTPSHIYTYPGTYYVKLSVKNNGGCSDSITKKIVIQGPTGNFGYLPKKVCNPGQINYSISANNTVRYIYDFANGTTYDTTASSVSFTYMAPGVYIPKIILINAAGCKVPVVGSDTIKVIGVETNILSDVTTFCDSGSVHFSDSTITNDLPVGVMWDFGDGGTSVANSPSHTYSHPGLYTVRLVAQSDFGCKDTAEKVNYIKVISSPKIKIGGDSSGCVPATLHFTGEFALPDTSALSWNWTFGNGQTSTVKDPAAQLFNAPGTYPINVQVVNSSGCTGTFGKTVVIDPKPVIDAGPDTTICKTRAYTLQPTGGATYTWNPDVTLSCLNCPNPIATPSVTTTYYVTAKSVNGCVAVDSVLVKVAQPFKIAVEKANAVCVGKPVALKASGADFYQWTPSLYLDNASLSQPTSRPDSSMTYKVIGSDKRGCFKDSGTVSIKVHQIPTVDITNGESISVLLGSTATLSTVTTGNVTSYQWSPNQWLDCATCANPVTSAKDNITYSVTVTNEGKCTATDKITINMVCDNANVFLPNTFSPNGDGMNDRFYPRGSGLYTIKSFKVFNRWGQLVFEKRGMSPNVLTEGWDGKLNGLDQPTDVYVYLMELVCVNGQILPFKGNVTLLR